MTLEIVPRNELHEVWLTRGPNTVLLATFKTLSVATEYVARVSVVLDQRAVLIP